MRHAHEKPVPQKMAFFLRGEKKSASPSAQIDHKYKNIMNAYCVLPVKGLNILCTDKAIIKLVHVAN